MTHRTKILAHGFLSKMAPPIGSIVRPVEHYNTRVLPIDPSRLGQFIFSHPRKSFLEDWDLSLSTTSPDAAHLLEAAAQLRTTDIPVAFPTETVYGLGADALRASAVRGIYVAKQRPSDNPLIVHICSLSQLRSIFEGPSVNRPYPSIAEIPSPKPHSSDPIPSIYHPLIARFWPGPLTIILPLPTPNCLAPPVTASLKTFAVRMPSSLLALALIHTAGVPLAAPSANASTKPSPTTAAHVLHDLSGRIKTILDGGPCDIGVESTVVDGLAQPPVVLRPGGVSIESLRECPGWEGVVVGYKDGAEVGVPRAPGMKYRHYSPRAKVVLVDGPLTLDLINRFSTGTGSIGVVSTKEWKDKPIGVNGRVAPEINAANQPTHPSTQPPTEPSSLSPPPFRSPARTTIAQIRLSNNKADDAPAPAPTPATDIFTIALGPDMTAIAHGLFGALRELDGRGVSVIFVESVGDEEGRGEAAAAVMNRLRKAAEVEVESGDRGSGS